MLSHLRFHRRAPSNPPSPLPDQGPADDATTQHERPQSAREISQRPDVRPRSPNHSQMPPMLPPIARVASTGSDRSFALRDDPPPTAQDSRAPPARPAYNDDSNVGFIGGLALQNLHQHRQAAQGLQPDSAAATAGHLPESQLSRAKPPPPPINTGLAARPAMTATKPAKSAKSSSFITPTDLQHGSGSSTGKRPTGTRFASEPTPPGPGLETQKGRKGLPFLKNPMSSLLMRRKTGHSAPDPQPFLFSATPTYDPRIRGTRVHDFSAPRPKKPISSADSVSAAKSDAGVNGAVHVGAGEPASAPLPADANRVDSVEPSRHPSERTTHSDQDSGLAQGAQEVGKPPLAAEAVPVCPVPQVPPKDESATNFRTLSSATTCTAASATPSRPAASSSVRTTASRKVSVSAASRRDSVASAIPKHMKSTSSRFSFDMIGAAKQEKLLEERHRQREQEKKTSDDSAGYHDDFDEDSFDYDAMMDDDGLEERIPGVNADYDDEEDFEAAMDPDNDQENFAGFVFQRSNTGSSLASPNTPGMLATPRDTNGKVIGFAMTKDTTPEIPAAASPMFPDAIGLPKPDENAPGLGIQGLDASTATASAEPTLQPSHPPGPVSLGLPPRTNNDDLYFDDGLADELDFENDGAFFDESIFDNNDTDQYGRPIPGAFAQAQEAMRAAQQPQQPPQEQPCKRDSDMASSLSAQSAVTLSTGDTSLSAGLQQPAAQQTLEPERSSSPKPAPPEAVPIMGIPGQDLAYQAALAEAAQMAAASGKFRRSSSPPPPDDDELPMNSAELSPPDAYLEDLNDYETDDFNPDNFGDDFDFDDEAIIAEANASALANDADGFYGQEFGFYSAPLPIPQSSHHQSHQHQLYHTPSSSSAGSASSSNNILSAENLYQYANGGYFGPAGAGVGRSASGRVVSREPNLTPITERSEYSNRNSVMSFTMPPPPVGGEGGARNSASASLTSPGLAQLASLLSEEGDGVDDRNMSLEALMRLRSRAWGGGGGGGSQGSSREGSPRSERADGAATSPYGHQLGLGSGLVGHAHVRATSALAALWSGAEAGSGTASPTLAGLGTGMPLSAAPGLAPGGGSAGGANGVVSPLPLRPPPLSLFSPVPVPAPSPGQAQGPLGGSACSPVLEGEEESPSSAGVDAAPVCGLAPALPLRTKSPVQMQDQDGGQSRDEGTSPQQQFVPRKPGMGHRHKGSADSISYIKDDESGANRWVVERRRTAETGEVEILGREVVEGGRI
ncbi:AGC-kinase C-terminal domain-containing protein [Madurella fahalii]|uniref:AGC-kinase C-terminal domain-containing protein n=1 Tax=Madurella fahalii TaxID=1157608 RepID=A0ABQ0G4K8_9PEZI